MGILTILVGLTAVAPLLAQSPMARLTNVTRPGNSDFKVGDRFEVLIAGAPNQAISVRTMFNDRIDWSPVIAQTDADGEWSTSGTYGKEDFGSWTTVWTVGGKLATPILQFSVDAPCLTTGRGLLTYMGRLVSETCDTAEGERTFVTPSDSDPFRTPDGRLIQARLQSALTADQYKTDVLQSLIVGPADSVSSRRLRRLGDEAAALITKRIDGNALSDEEVHHVLAIIRAAFEQRDSLQPAIRDPLVTAPFLRALANATDSDDLKRQISDTMRYVQTQQRPLR